MRTRKAEKGGRKKFLKWKKVLKVGAAGVFLLLVLVSWLTADSTCTANFSVELKEWLVLEINSGVSRMISQDNSGAFLTTPIISGQPVEIKALISVSPEKNVILRGTVFSSSAAEADHSEIEWIGEGDITGRGKIELNQETIFAIWHGPALKSGRIVFYSAENNGQASFEASFVLSAI